MEVKKTLLMPRTDFEMRGNLPNKEPLILQSWNDFNLYNLMLEKNEGCDTFLLHDGPPYANGNMHCGHMLNRVLKDFVLRYKNMRGFYTPFIPGWDTHGLPIENVITKKGINRKTTPIAEFRQKCDEFAREQVKMQIEQVKRLGVLGDFEHRYMTLTPDYEASQLRVFADMALKGYIYKGSKPVYWSPSSESALAEAEIEYHDVKSHAVFVKFNVKDGKNVLTPLDSFVIWTTTPWTLPANLAISVNPKTVYGLYETESGRLVFLKDLAESVKAELEFKTFTLIKEFKGEELEFISTHHPFLDRESVVILGEHVTSDAGTGAVHTAPGHGEDDFVVGKKYKLAPLCPVDSKGYMTKEAGSDLEGLFYEAANDEILKKLKATGALLKDTEIVHSYPHDWRTNKPVIFRATPQWFCSISEIKKTLLAEVAGAKWTPSWGEIRIHNMIKDREDWCISRQRAWGVPLPIIYHEDDTPIIDKDVFEHIIDLVSLHGSNIWFELEAKDLLPKGYKHERSPNGKFKKETDIMDVWFDSGSSSIAVLKEKGLKFPADMYLEGSDQYRGWFNSSLIIACATNGVAPYKHVVTHGFILDEKGEKMSKSKNNGIDPLKLINTYGSDICRLWVASIDYQSDVRIGENLIKQVSESYRKIRNTFKFLLGNLANSETSRFDITKDKVTEFERTDLYILHTLKKVCNAVIEEMDKYNFSGALMLINNFMVSDLSAFYLDITKDILYCEHVTSLRRKQVQNVIYHCVESLIKVLTPFIPYTMDEVYQKFDGKVRSTQLLDYVTTNNDVDATILEEYEMVKKVRSDVLKALETARTSGIIGSSQAARLTLKLKQDELVGYVNKFGNAELARLFIVSHVEINQDLNEGLDLEVSKVKVSTHSGEKCERCWNYYDTLELVEEVHLCERCKSAVTNHE